jgi:UDP-N-acetylmuramate--alanine ligase
MTRAKSYFFCGIGGSGMLPLACIVRAQGAEVAGSDRSLDQGRVGDKFDFLRSRGIALFAQDGSGIDSADQILVTSAAIEESVPDVQAARRVGAQQLSRPQLLAELFNAAPTGVAVAGTSGKSTTTGMIGWILHDQDLRPTVMNGAVMKNFVTPDTPFASALVGDGNIFVSEVDESDGSIALYEPEVAVLNNISLDHKTLDELRSLFLAFMRKARTMIVNLDDPDSRALAGQLPRERLVTFGIDSDQADYRARNVEEAPLSVAFEILHAPSGEIAHATLPVPGRHNVSNALAAVAAAQACGVPLVRASEALRTFAGLRRRFDIVGTRNGVTVIDDFGHNPDKIAATLATLHAFPGRLLLLFQPHGYGPLKVMKDPLIACFADNMMPDDMLIMPDPVYFGGTVERAVGSEDIVAGVDAGGRKAEHIADRNAAGDRLVGLARDGDRIVVMGARDDTLSSFAADLLARL